jgi:hypothetical protein
MSGARWVFALLAASAAGAAGAGCMVLVSDGDYKVGTAPDGGGATDGGRDSAPPVDAGHEAGSVDAGIDSPGAVDSGTDSPPMVCTAPDVTAANHKAVIQSCMLMGGCTPWFLPPSTLSTCISYDYPALAQYTRCATAATCSAYETCTGIGPAPAAAACTNSATATYLCSGTQAVTCGGGLVTDPSNGYAYDCAIRGGHCQTYTGGVGCVVENTCTTPAGTYECGASNDLYQCIGGVGFGANCAQAFNATCMNGSQGNSCYYPLQPCATGAGDSCNGTTAIECDTATGGKQVQYNCGAMGLSCGSTIANAYYCLGTGCTPSDESSCMESCDSDGTHINVCIGGAQVKLNCPDYGLTKCSSYLASPSNGFPNPFSLCTP